MDTRNGKEMQQILGAVEREGEDGKKESYWTRIGVAFKNKDGVSWNLKFDYVPARPEITIQLRPFNPKDKSESHDKAA
jgi:hypothetical protein